MPKNVTYTCDMCKKQIEWTAFSVETITIKSPAFVYDVYEVPQPDPTYCSRQCLGKSLQWWAEFYDKENS